MPINLVKENTPMLQGQLLNDSESLEFHMGKKKSLMKQLRTTVRKMFPFYQKAKKKAKLHTDNLLKPVMPGADGTVMPNKHHVLPRTIREFSSPKVFHKWKRTKIPQNASIQLDVNIVEERAQSVSGTNRHVEARRMTKRISVVSLPPGIRKVSYLAKKKRFPVFKKKKKNMPSVWYHSDITLGKLQMEVDNLLDNISEKSIQLLALRSAELQHCESLGDKILQSSKQFQRVSLKTTKKHKLKNMCFSCRCCC